MQVCLSSNHLWLNPTRLSTRQQLAKVDLGSLTLKYLHFPSHPHSKTWE